MVRLALPLLALLIAFPAAAADSPAAPGDGLAAVEALGRINGTALACGQPAIVSRARNAIITAAPKTRAVGDAFEAATNAAFLAQGKAGSCPDGGAFSRQLDGAEKRLQTAFAEGK